jgi:hypothetical protein
MSIPLHVDILSFFVPDREYLEDLDGLLIYLSEKVKLGHVCIYCQKRFSSGRACQAHMLSTSHCKVLYEEDVDLDEFEDFYDFSSQYENEPALAGEGGDEGDQGALVARTLEVNHLGELVLLDGRNVGTRAYARYYRQRYAPVDMRESTMARRREELHRLESRLGMLKLSPDQINGLTNAEVAAVMVKQRRTERKALVVAEVPKTCLLFLCYLSILSMFYNTFVFGTSLQLLIVSCFFSNTLRSLRQLLHL